MATPLLDSVKIAFARMAPFELSSVEGFPYSQWMTQVAYYTDLRNVYKGTELKAVVVDQKTGREVEKFPIKINPLRQTCMKHAAKLIGQGIDSIRPDGLPVELVPPIEKKDLAETFLKFFSRVVNDSSMGALFASNAFLSQYLGGSWFAARWRPDLKKLIVSAPLPDEVLAFPNGNDFWNLREAWIVRKISADDAKAYGHPGPFDNSLPYYYIEHWTRTSYKISVNEFVLKDAENEPMEGENPFKIVPLVYIPHIREERFIGEGIITDAIRGIIREINLRWADTGDAVSDDSHSYVAVRNVRGNVKTIVLADGRSLIDLGASTGVTGENQPDMFAVNAKSTSEPMLKLGKELYEFYRREANHPAVADGEDEGSQRSSLTISTRMAPLVDEIIFERIFWTTGIITLAKILTKMGIAKGIGELTEEMLDLVFTVKWQSMLPRDREALNEEVAIRAAHNIGSIEHLMGLYDDVRDPDAEWRKVLKQQKDLAEIEAKKTPPQTQNTPMNGEMPKDTSQGADNAEIKRAKSPDTNQSKK